MQSKTCSSGPPDLELLLSLDLEPQEWLNRKSKTIHKHERSLLGVSLHSVNTPFQTNDWTLMDYMCVDCFCSCQNCKGHLIFLFCPYSHSDFCQQISRLLCRGFQFQLGRSQIGWLWLTFHKSTCVQNIYYSVLYNSWLNVVLMVILLFLLTRL